jgi:hypothetical protein
MTNEELQEFRQGFCEKAAELGILPSELMSFSGYKQSGVDDVAKNTLHTGLLLGSLGLLGGTAAGALSNYLYNKAKFELDPDDSILPNYSAVEEAKKLHLLAKYRNAKKLVQSGLA